MNNVTREGKSDGGAQSRIEDPKKRAEDQAQLASEAENRSRRIQNRKAARLKADKARQAQRVLATRMTPAQIDQARREAISFRPK